MDFNESIYSEGVFEVGCHLALTLDAMLAPVPVREVSQAMFVDFLMRR